VSHKPDRNWTPKEYKEPEIPIPTKLVKNLKTLKAKSNRGCPLVFPTTGCNPKLDFLDRLKAIAERAELDSDNFWLPKFRSTFATRCLWAGVDLRTVQQWLGHSDMESTMRYLKPARSQKVQGEGERDLRLTVAVDPHRASWSEMGKYSRSSLVRITTLRFCL